MAKIIDISEKIGKPQEYALQVHGQTYPICAGASTVIQALALLSGGGDTVQNSMQVMELLMKPEDRDRLLATGISFSDYMAVLEAALDLIIEGGDSQGETGTRTTT